MRLVGLALPLAVAAALLIAACGGDDSNDSDDFIADADAICTDQAEQLRDIALAADVPPSDEKSVAQRYEQTVPVIEDAQSQLEDLEAPDELSDDYDEFLSLRQQRIDAIHESIDASNAGDSKGFAAANEKVSGLAEQTSAAGEQIGFGSCANVLSDEDAHAVEDFEDEFAASTDAEQICNEFFLPQYVALAYEGGVEDCLKDPLTTKVTHIDYQGAEGVDGVTARATVEVLNGPDQGTYTDTLYYVDGAWRLYSTAIAPK